MGVEVAGGGVLVGVGEAGDWVEVGVADDAGLVGVAVAVAPAGVDVAIGWGGAPPEAWPESAFTIREDVSTTSKLLPIMLPSACRAVSFQRESGMPLMNQFEPLSASSMP